ncbi:hypothetical protein Pst134EB_010665 [Puccinia striiformis f. sp. tritici]|nr:hypothetical protein Pst134EB_010665 [Puccinia striiformis f. sp. tritici]
MPSHLRNSRDLSGEQRRRNVEANLPNLAGQRTVQRAEGKPSVSRPGAEERPRTGHRSDSDGNQLPSHFSSAKVGHVNPSTASGGPSNSTAVGSSSERRDERYQQPGNCPSVDPSPILRQQAVGDVRQHVPLSVVHVRRGQEDQRLGSHEGSSESSDFEPNPHQPIPDVRRDDGSVQELVGRCRAGDNDQARARSPSRDDHGDSSLYPSSYSPGKTILASGGRSNGLPGNYPGASNGSYSFVDLVSPPDHPERGLCTSSKPNSRSRSASRLPRNERVELRGSEPPSSPVFRAEPSGDTDCPVRPEPGLRAELRADSELYVELHDAVAAKPQPTYVRAPQTPSTPAGLTRYFTPRGPYFQRLPGLPPDPKRQIRPVSLQPQRTSSTPASSSATARYPLPCSTPARWKLGGIREEKEESPTSKQYCQDFGGGRSLLESRESLRENAEDTRKVEYSKQKSPKSTPSSVDSYLNFSFNPALEQLSDASQKEFLLSNINNRLVHDNPFLIEDKLQQLFSTFISELSGTIDAFPGTLLESCVEKLSSTINSSVLELIKSEITPLLLDNTLSHLRELGGEKNPHLMCAKLNL